VEAPYRFPSVGFSQKRKGTPMNPTDNTTADLLPNVAAAFQPTEKFPAAEPENFGALPEDQWLMPENKPEKNLKIQVYDEGKCVYDEGQPGLFGWKPRSPLDRLTTAEVTERRIGLAEQRANQKEK
jgi:hypothetical protein